MIGGVVVVAVAIVVVSGEGVGGGDGSGGDGSGGTDCVDGVGVIGGAVVSGLSYLSAPLCPEGRGCPSPLLLSKSSPPTVSTGSGFCVRFGTGGEVVGGTDCIGGVGVV